MKFTVFVTFSLPCLVHFDVVGLYDSLLLSFVSLIVAVLCQCVVGLRQSSAFCTIRCSLIPHRPEAAHLKASFSSLTLAVLRVLPYIFRSLESPIPNLSPFSSNSYLCSFLIIRVLSQLGASAL